ncbi:hypothetical protein [Dyadobacter flavalbus]|uniref:hypothetical protein n=1 Tax=Dyadobacter flavalbus TaxID=2579942 RepID=UPI001E45D0A0|nr:hypothetical protein [Dyadobacter flavalbus]
MFVGVFVADKTYPKAFLLKAGNPDQKPFFHWGKFLLTGLLIIPGSLFFLYPQIFYCEFIRFSGFVSVDGKTYFSPDIKPPSYNVLRKIIRQSAVRVDSFYNGRKSDPVLIICSDSRQYQKYCNSTEGAGCSLGTPWGSSYVILNAQGMNADVISHEMSHTELLERLGWWTIANEVPQWFNEGTALMLDRRFVNNPDAAGRYLDYMEEWLYYTGGGQQILELENITSIKGFFSGGQRQVMLAYMSSGMEVSYWLAVTGKNALQDLITRINNGQTFAEAYADMQKKEDALMKKQLPANPLRVREVKKIAE